VRSTCSVPWTVNDPAVTWARLTGTLTRQVVSRTVTVPVTRATASPSAARRLIAASADGASASDRARKLTGSLTDRETEVLACLGEGLSNGQIAAQLYLSEATVKGYVSRMLDKLGCANRTQAGLIAHDAGLVRP
jgi:DNA-binding NarL/FixJ family response regulator